MAERRKVTIRQVADAAGVSPATVSLVFNGKGEVAPATRRRVLEIGKQLEYRPGSMSKVFRSGRAYIIGVVVGHSGTPIWELTYLPYYRGIIAGAAMEALEFGYSITAMPVKPSGDLGGPIRPDGIIVVDPGPDDPLIKSAIDDGMAVVSAGGHSSSVESTRLRSVRYDLDRGVPAALGALQDVGAVRPAFFRGSVIDEYTLESQRVYLAWCQSEGVEPLVFVIDPGQTPIEGARELLSGARGEFDAVYCINESYASAITTAAAERGISVPETLAISVAGEAHSATVDPRLVYLNLDPITLGAQCARLLIDILEGGDPEDARLPMSLDRPGQLA